VHDRIETNGLTVTTVVGALPHEHEIAQPMRFDVPLFVDLRDARRTDKLSDTVHYGEVAQRVAAVVRENMLARLATESPRSSSVEVSPGVSMRVSRVRRSEAQIGIGTCSRPITLLTSVPTMTHSPTTKRRLGVPLDAGQIVETAEPGNRDQHAGT
jgi:dihydroneopterin aldolase